jgi:hypothetical protein
MHDMRVGIGSSNTREAFQSGKSAVRDAVRAGNIHAPGLAVAFCGGQVNHREFLRGIRESVGEIPVIGGSTTGIITGDALSYAGHPSGVAVIQLDRVRCQVAAAGNLDADERVAGRHLIAGFSPPPEDALLLMFYDSIKIPASPHPSGDECVPSDHRGHSVAPAIAGADRGRRPYRGLRVPEDAAVLRRTGENSIRSIS